MDAESEVWDEIADRLTVIYNQMRFLRESAAQRAKEDARDAERLSHLEKLETQYLALLASEPEGIPA